MYLRPLSVTFIVYIIISCRCGCRCKEELPKNWRVHFLLNVQGACQPKNQKVATCTFGK